MQTSAHSDCLRTLPQLVLANTAACCGTAAASATHVESLKTAHLQVPHAGGAGLIHTDDDREDSIVECTTHGALVPRAVLRDDLVHKAASAGQQQQQRLRHDPWARF